MTGSRLCAVMLLLTIAAVPAAAQAPAAGGQRLGLAASLQRGYNQIKNNLIAQAELMPESEYAFKPTAEMRSFGQLVGHIADYNFIFCAPAAATSNPNAGNSFEALTAKADLTKALADSFAYCDAVFTALTDERAAEVIRQGANEVTRGGALLGVLAHGNEEYGYGAVYLRLRGIVPPSTARGAQPGRGAQPPGGRGGQ